MNQTWLDQKLKTKENDFDPKINMWCDFDSSNKSIKFELIPSWFGPIFSW
jgi:hypothetical protein